MRITGEEQEARRKHMINCAYKLFIELGIDNVSISSLAKASGVSRNSIFRYFENKFALVQCTQIILWQKITNYILLNNKDLLINAENGLEKLKILLSTLEDLYEDHSEYILFFYDYKLYLMRNHIMFPEAQYTKITQPLSSIFIDSLKMGHDDGSIRDDEPAETQLITSCGILSGYISELVLFDRIYSSKNPWKSHFEVVTNHIINRLVKETVF